MSDIEYFQVHSFHTERAVAVLCTSFSVLLFQSKKKEKSKEGKTTEKIRQRGKKLTSTIYLGAWPLFFPSRYVWSGPIAIVVFSLVCCCCCFSCATKITHFFQTVDKHWALVCPFVRPSIHPFSSSTPLHPRHATPRHATHTYIHTGIFFFLGSILSSPMCACIFVFK